MPGARVQGTDGQMVKFASWRPSDKLLCSKKSRWSHSSHSTKQVWRRSKLPKHACSSSSVQIKFNLPYPIFGCLVMFRDSRSWNQVPHPSITSPMDPGNAPPSVSRPSTLPLNVSIFSGRARRLQSTWRTWMNDTMDFASPSRYNSHRNPWPLLASKKRCKKRC